MVSQILRRVSNFSYYGKDSIEDIHQNFAVKLQTLMIAILPYNLLTCWSWYDLKLYESINQIQKSVSQINIKTEKK